MKIFETEKYQGPRETVKSYTGADSLEYEVKRFKAAALYQSSAKTENVMYVSGSKVNWSRS